jgi:hypothetical protein
MRHNLDGSGGCFCAAILTNNLAQIANGRCPVAFASVSAVANEALRAVYATQRTAAVPHSPLDTRQPEMLHRGINLTVDRRITTKFVVLMPSTRYDVIGDSRPL